MSRFAEIVVNADAPPGAPWAGRPLTYGVPEGLDLAPGACVAVPFGKREVIGYVVGLGEEPPPDLAPEAIKDILARVAGADLAPAVLATARWMARAYLCDLAQCVRSVVPDAQSAHIVRRVALAPNWEARLPEITTLSHRDLVLRLAALGGQATGAELSEAAGGARIESPLSLLRRRGMLVDRWSVEPPRAGARKVRGLRLSVPWDDAEAEAARREPKAPGQARLLRALAAAGGGPMPLAEALALSQSSPDAAKRLEQASLVAPEIIEVRRRPFRFVAGAAVPPVLTGEQQAAMEEITRRLETRQANVALLYGVTASGKTEVYLRAIAETRRRGRAALVLVPEIALTAQVVDTFRARIGDRVAVLHSALSEGERRDEWQRIARGEADVVVGARSGVFAPIGNVGLIVVDEEHEGSYKQDSPAPRYHARDVAIARARATGATVLLGSATPAVESFHQAQTGAWGFLPLRQRALFRPLPSVEIIDQREEWKKFKPGLFSERLQEALAEVLAKREQTILFLNRRGSAKVVLCRDCGHTMRCLHCDVSLTLHETRNVLRCHHCDYQRRPPDVCPACQGLRIRRFSIGTEGVEKEVRRIFPDARVLRMDRDTTEKKDAHIKMLRAFRGGEADILIGTQMVAKGLDFAGVTLVGVISADTALNIPDFRASERAFQLLTQVSGRAGRGRKPGHVLVQTFNPEHESVAAAASHDYDAFYAREIVNRRELRYPPFSRLANVVSQDEDAREAESRLRALASLLGGRSPLDPGAGAIGGDDDLEVLGPAPCPLSRLRGRYRWHLLLKAADVKTLRERLSNALGALRPTERGGLTVDIDPMSLL